MNNDNDEARQFGAYVLGYIVGIIFSTVAIVSTPLLLIWASNRMFGTNWAFDLGNWIAIWILISLVRLATTPYRFIQKEKTNE